MRVAVMDIGQMFVLVRQWQVSVTLPREDFDGAGLMVRIVVVDGMRMLDDGVRMEMAMVSRTDDEHTRERHRKRDDGRHRERVAVDRPGQECPDEGRQRKDRLPTSGAH